MRVTFKTLTIAIGLAALPLIGGAGAANAAVGVSFDLGNVAVGFSDGYYDSGHHWHRWAHRTDAAHYRAAHAEGYHTWRHDDPHHKNDHY